VNGYKKRPRLSKKGKDMSKRTSLIWLATALASFCVFGRCLAAQTVKEVEGTPRHGFISDQAADKWQNALVTGNGKMGATVFCSPYAERIVLNHERLFRPKSDSKDDRSTPPFHPAFDLRLTIEAKPSYEKYLRWVNFESGEVGVRFRDGRGTFVRRLFVSRPDNVIVYSVKPPEGHAEGQTPAKLNCKMAIVSTEKPPDPAEITTKADWISYRLSYQTSKGGYEGLGRVVCKGGKAESDGEWVTVSDADELLVLVRVAPLADFEKSTLKTMQADLAALEADYDKLLARHAPVHGEMFNRVTIDLDGGKDRSLPIETLLASAREGDVSRALLEKVYEAGRYVVLCSSGDWPPNLQGIWNPAWRPPWDSDYHMDANLQCAVASMLSGDLHECLDSYFDYIEFLVPDWRENAKELYRSRGVFASIACSTHGRVWGYESWTAGAGWLAQPFYDYYLHAGDRQFLAKRAVPLMKEVALFYEDFLKGKEGPDGNYVFKPSYSPEHGGGDKNATMDIAVAKDTLKNLIAACEELGIEKEGVARWKAMLKKMPTYLVNEDGALKEWVDEESRDNYNHRHVSHLYPLFQAFEADPLETPELCQAIKRAAELRLAHSTRPTGFGLGEMAVVFARLGEGEKVYEILTKLAAQYHHRSLVSHVGPRWSNIYNVDANGILPAAMQDMLVFSRPGRVSLIPAVSKHLPRGTVEGILCRGQIKIERLRWDLNSGQVEAALKSAKPQTITLRLPRDIVSINVAPRDQTQIKPSPYGKTCRKLVLPPGLGVAIKVELAGAP